MSHENQEIEAKFYVHTLAPVEARLQALGAVCKVPRGFEYNLRYDDDAGSLRAAHKVLRLRKFDDVRLTFKGPGEALVGALARTEIELIVQDFDTAQKFLEGLGYHVTAVYEKYRAMYSLAQALITLDELPYGNFVEIEAVNAETIRKLAKKLGLNPEAAIPASYQGLFEQVKAVKNLPAKNLVFGEFETIRLSAADLGVEPAEESD